jgi:hypothetical protein
MPGVATHRPVSYTRPKTHILISVKRNEWEVESWEKWEAAVKEEVDDIVIHWWTTDLTIEIQREIIWLQPRHLMFESI